MPTFRLPDSLRMALCALAVALGAAFALPGQHIAWAWVNPAGQGATFTPSATYQFDSAGGTITVDRDPVQQNRFRVRFPNCAPGSGVVLASAYGGNHTAVVNGWSNLGADVVAWIELYAATGVPANNAMFVASYREGAPATGESGYLWADQPTAASYTPSTYFSFNASHPDPTITRLGVGRYEVTFPGLWPNLGLTHAQVTSYRPQAAGLVRSRVESVVGIPTGVVVGVQCRDVGGGLVDAMFVLACNVDALVVAPERGSGAFVHADQPTTASYVPMGHSNGADGPRNAEHVYRLGIGYYRVHLPSVVSSASSTALVSASSAGDSYASVQNWSANPTVGTDVYVRTYNSSGMATDAGFWLSYLTNHPTEDVAWEFFQPNAGNPVLQRGYYGYSTSGMLPQAFRSASVPHVYQVIFHGVKPANGVVHVTPYYGIHFATIEDVVMGPYGMEVWVATYNRNGAGAPTAPFAIEYRSYGANARREAYLYADQPTTTSYTVDPSTSWNGTRGTPTIVRAATGAYAVTLPGLGGGSATGERGNVPVTARKAGAMRYAVIRGWHTVGADLVVDVQCYGAGGVAADSGFELSFNEVAAPIPERQGSGTHLWANLPTSPSYTPSAIYLDSNATLGPANGETITRTGVGSYTVELPNVGDPATVTVSAYGPGAATATCQQFIRLVNTTRIVVQTWDTTGAPADAMFTLRYLSARPAVGTPALVSHYGTGCNGPVLISETRPVQGTGWALRVDGVPPGAMLGFVQLGFSNPGLALGPSAPGCTQLTSGDANVLYPGATSFGYGVQLPTGLSFLGLELRAQGGALVPGVNALGLVATDAVLGVLGDV